HSGYAAGDGRREVTGQALIGGVPGRVDVHVGGGPAGRHLPVVERAHATSRVAVHDEPPAADVARLWEHDRERKSDRHRGVDGITALLDDLDPDLARERTTGHDPRPRARHGDALAG